MPLLEAELITINVHALGPSGSGKTVFMAAMYPQLRIKRGKADFYLKTDHATRVSRKVFSAGHEGVPRPRMAISRAVSCLILRMVAAILV